MNLLPLDLTEAIHQALRSNQREPDGLLHCSGDMTGSLRHVMLRMAGAPEKQNDMVTDTILEIGTLMHKRVAEMFVSLGLPFMQEVKLDQWLPDGWGGTADWIFYHPEYEAFVLGDLKTTTGEGIPFIAREGIKENHHHQLSAYWHALIRMGLPMVKGVAVLYMPKNRAKNTKTEPLLVEAEPLDVEYLDDLMRERRAAVDTWLNAWVNSQDPNPGDDYLWDGCMLEGLPLAPPQDRVLKVVWNRDKYDVKLVPHWSAQFCPYDDELCDCDKQGETKVGEYTKDGYKARKGYEQVNPPELTDSQRRRFES